MQQASEPIRLCRLHLPKSGKVAHSVGMARMRHEAQRYGAIHQCAGKIRPDLQQSIAAENRLIVPLQIEQYSSAIAQCLDIVGLQAQRTLVAAERPR